MHELKTIHISFIKYMFKFIFQVLNTMQWLLLQQVGHIIISFKLTTVNPDRNIFSINVDLISTFFYSTEVWSITITKFYKVGYIRLHCFQIYLKKFCCIVADFQIYHCSWFLNIILLLIFKYNIVSYFKNIIVADFKYNIVADF